MNFSQFGLSSAILKAVEGTGYSIPTEIQIKAIPEAVAGRDVMACAPTGTGKTAAFVLPMLNRLLNQPALQQPGLPRALVLTPTRELAQQIEASILCLSAFTHLHPVAIYGGVFQSPQVQGLKNSDIIVATPGRLLDHLRGNTANLSAVEYLVVDEADRMFDMGFAEDVQNIIGRVNRDRQTLLFSATMNAEVRALVASIQRDPVCIEVGETNKPVESVTQYFYSVSNRNKIDLLVHILSQVPDETVLVFSRTKHGTDSIARDLRRKRIRAEAIHSDRLQTERDRALAGFKSREYTVLVATDIAARGIDVSGISCVINFDTPAAPEDYIHRIGRTGRADKRGTALTFVSRDEYDNFLRIEQVIGCCCELLVYPENEKAESSLGPSRHADRNRRMKPSSSGGRQRYYRPQVAV
jgi:ATP-dependent RNA helicase RhlE